MPHGTIIHDDKVNVEHDKFEHDNIKGVCDCDVQCAFHPQNQIDGANNNDDSTHSNDGNFDSDFNFNNDKGDSEGDATPSIEETDATVMLTNAMAIICHTTVMVTVTTKTHKHPTNHCPRTLSG